MAPVCTLLGIGRIAGRRHESRSPLTKDWKNVGCARLLFNTNIHTSLSLYSPAVCGQANGRPTSTTGLTPCWSRPPRAPWLCTLGCLRALPCSIGVRMRVDDALADHAAGQCRADLGRCRYQLFLVVQMIKAETTGSMVLPRQGCYLDRVLP